MISLDRFAHGGMDNHPEYDTIHNYYCDCCGWGTDSPHNVVFEESTGRCFCNECVGTETVIKCSKCGRYTLAEDMEEVADDTYYCDGCYETYLEEMEDGK